MEKNPILGVRKGAWAKEEDILLRKCIEKYGEGKWHLVPLRAAGRIPGRTANDVKNFWNTHIQKKSGESRCRGSKPMITQTNIIRPQPRIFSKQHVASANWSKELNKPNELPNIDGKNPKNVNNPSSTDHASSSKYSKIDGRDENPKINQQPIINPPLQEEEVDECMRWWVNLLEITENGDGILLPEEDHVPIVEPILSPGFGDQNGKDYGVDDILNSLD
ncbi:hypothetical protein DH2020_041024 [Rehmannia glutinosa]|uniref:R2R3-MYB protein n=1 Tax=Rehmannia glutinosa TaxID=99300 RepID=A0ABR0URC0_REHGL